MSSDSNNGHSGAEDMNTTNINADQMKEAAKAQASSAGSSEVSYDDTDVLAQLRDLGSNLVAAVQAIGQSEQVRSFIRDLGTGLRNAGEQVGSAANNVGQNVGESDVLKGVKEQATKVTEHPMVRDLQTNFAQALRELNKRLATFAESTTSSKSESDAAEGEQLALPTPDEATPDKPTTKLNA